MDCPSRVSAGIEVYEVEEMRYVDEVDIVDAFLCAWNVHGDAAEDERCRCV